MVKTGASSPSLRLSPGASCEAAIATGTYEAGGPTPAVRLPGARGAVLLPPCSVVYVPPVATRVWRRRRPAASPRSGPVDAERSLYAAAVDARRASSLSGSRSGPGTPRSFVAASSSDDDSSAASSSHPSDIGALGSFPASSRHLCRTLCFGFTPSYRVFSSSPLSRSLSASISSSESACPRVLEVGCPRQGRCRQRVAVGLDLLLEDRDALLEVDLGGFPRRRQAPREGLALHDVLQQPGEVAAAVKGDIWSTQVLQGGSLDARLGRSREGRALRRGGHRAREGGGSHTAGLHAAARQIWGPRGFYASGPAPLLS